MHSLTFEISDSLQQALKKAPKAVEQHLGKGVKRSANEVARKEKQLAPKANTTLTNSIKPNSVSALKAIVEPAAEYAHFVVSNITGQQRAPAPLSILDWIKVKGITPNNPKHTKEDLAFAIAATIKKRGTAPNPFVENTVNAMHNRVAFLIKKSANTALAELGL